MSFHHSDVILSFQGHSINHSLWWQIYRHLDVILFISLSFEHWNDGEWYYVGMTEMMLEWQFQSSEAHSVISDVWWKWGISWFHSCHLISSPSFWCHLNILNQLDLPRMTSEWRMIFGWVWPLSLIRLLVKKINGDYGIETRRFSGKFWHTCLF